MIQAQVTVGPIIDILSVFDEMTHNLVACDLAGLLHVIHLVYCMNNTYVY